MKKITNDDEIKKAFEDYKSSLSALHKRDEKRMILIADDEFPGKKNRIIFRVKYKIMPERFNIDLRRVEIEGQISLYITHHSGKLEAKVPMGDIYGNSILASENNDIFLCRSLNVPIVGPGYRNIAPNVRDEFYSRSNRIFKVNGVEYLKLYCISNFSKDSLEDYVELIKAMKKIREAVRMEINSTKSNNNSDNHEDLLTNAKSALNSFKQIILTGPPGTGKTYLAKQLAISQATGVLFIDDPKEEFKRLSGKQKNQVKIVQFHPSYNYEDFVRGIQVETEGVEINYVTRNRIFAEMCEQACEQAQNEPGKNFVLIIDEINRANLAAVLGELIYALEYRGEEVETPYKVRESKKLKVPDNLFIIGTMNTADRSIGHIDYAVRRRFAFVPVLPEKGVINSENGKKLFDCVETLFLDKRGENAKNAKTLSPDFHYDDVQPGHTYFMYKPDQGEDELETLKMKFTYQVYPLLVEYYKDGVLLAENDNELSLTLNVDNKIKISTPESSATIMGAINDFLNPSEPEVEENE